VSGLRLLALRHARHHAGRTTILVLCLALAGALPLTASTLMSRYRADLVARGEATPLLAGPEGNRFDLTLGALYFRSHGLAPVRAGLVEDLAREAQEVGGAVIVPLHTRGRARGWPVVGTTPDYYERRGLVPAAGTLPLLVGDATLGASAATRLELGPGDTLFTDPAEELDIATPASLELVVVGVLPRTGTPDDDAVFVDVKTAWAVEGHGHGHEDVTAEGALPDGFVLSRTEDEVAVSPALIEERRLGAENQADFHLHGDPAELPLSGVLVFPATEKAGTLLRATVDRWPGVQVLVPRKVIEDLLAVVLQIKSIFDRLSGVLVLSTALFSGLVLLLSARLRADEFRTLHAIGCGRGAVLQLVAWELAGLVLLAGGVAGALTLAVLRLLPDLVHTL
jgi:putative ABC transport system permease protein